MDGESWGEVTIRDREEPNDRIESRFSIAMQATDDGEERRNGGTRSRERNLEPVARDSGNLGHRSA